MITTLDGERLNLAACGQWCDDRGFEVTRERMAQFATATDDPIAQHRAGDMAPPTFGAVPGLATLVSLITESIPESLFGRMTLKRQEVRFHRPMLPGTRLTTRGQILGYAPAEDGTEALIHTESHGEDGELVVEQMSALYISGFDVSYAVGECARWNAVESHLGIPIRAVRAKIDDDRSFLDAGVFGDVYGDTPMPADLPFARTTELQQIVLQGLRSLSFSSRGVLEALTTRGRAPEAKRLSVELVSPLYVYPGCKLATTICRARLSTGLPRFIFHSVAGRVLVLRGAAEFS